jgi:predicted DNA-binding transcriptional regulator AlpA
MISNEQTLLTEHELAARLNINVQTLRRQRRMGGPDAIRHIKIGKSVRYRWADVEEYLERHARLRTQRETAS